MSPNKGKPTKYIGFMAVGAPCAGMNGALKCAMQHLLTETSHQHRYRALAIYDGFDGLLKGEVNEWTIGNLAGLHHQGGIVIGANRYDPSKDKKGEIFNRIKKYQLQGLIVIGG